MEILRTLTTLTTLTLTLIEYGRLFEIKQDQYDNISENAQN